MPTPPPTKLPEGYPPIVAIGMSAGGLAAMTTLLQNTAADTGMAFVVVQHLDPHHDSLLVELLAKATAMAVVQIESGMQVSANRVHVIPPDTSLTMVAETLQLAARDDARPPLPIDKFLRTLAEERGCSAVAVLLSGTGSDGAAGVRAIADQGGLVLVQDPGDAEFDGMPTQAIATGCVDAVLPAVSLGAELTRLARAPEWRAAAAGAAAKDFGEDSEARREVFALLHAAAGIDFSRYRATTVRRRMQRRIGMCGQRSLGGYLDYVRANPGELHELAKDLLISVTRFFRDPEVFDYLAKRTFPELIRRTPPGEVVRIWVPACSTGEEVFSLAMIFVEAAQRMNSRVTCQVFGTDINETVLEGARRATYPVGIAADVSPERLERFFASSNDEHRLRRELRDLCVFSRHDLLRDPPLSRMDMVSCRNLMIYLEGAHREALALFHFALDPHSYLLLGRSETASSRPDLFEVVDRGASLFRSVGSVIGRTAVGARDARRRAPYAITLDPQRDGAAYEEIVAANEELQSLNEELESAKEESESVNEELSSVNQELSSRNAELRVAHDLLAATLDTVRSGLIVLDPDLKVVNANRSFYRTFQLLANEVLNRPITTVAQGCLADPIITRLLQQSRASGAVPEDVEVEVVGPDRVRRTIVVSVRWLAPGELSLMSIDDVTSLRELEANRRQAQKMEAIGHLAAGVAHDFNNLLTPIMAGAQIVLGDLPADSGMHPVVVGIGEAASRAAELTRQLLSYAGKARTFLERVDISLVVTQAANLLHGSMPARVQLRLDLESGLPLLLADVSQTHQLVDNLIKNAIEAIGDKAGTVLVRSRRQSVGRDEIQGLDAGTRLAPGDYVTLEVHDTGVGMNEDIQRQMFDPFFTTKFTGRGLGLAVILGIVRGLRGTIIVNSVPGRGTAIRVLLLAVTGDTATPAPSRVVQSRSAKVLLVDDEPIVLQATRIALEQLGHEVVTANSGAQALELLATNVGVELVLLDATMPGVDGMAVLRGIRAMPMTIPVVICSGLGDAAVEAEFVDMGVAGFLHKPFTMQKLSEALAVGLAR